MFPVRKALKETAMNYSQTIIAAAILLLCVIVPASAENMLEFPPTGTDVNSFRCEGNIISTGDSARDVMEKCGEPVDRGSMQGRRYDIWVYHYQGENFVYYLGFLNRTVQRIHSVSCNKNDPYCD